MGAQRVSLRTIAVGGIAAIACMVGIVDGAQAACQAPPTKPQAIPPDLTPGTYSYFCRVHPYMRGAFRVVPN